MKPVLQILALLTLTLGSPVRSQSLAFPVYGNYCGINHGAGPLLIPPVDPVDAACMRHDICTDQHGRFDCGCDIALMNELRYQRWPTPETGEAARAIYEAIAVVPCSNPMGMVYKAAHVVQDLSTDGLTGRESPLLILRRLGHVGETGVLHAYRRRH